MVEWGTDVAMKWKVNALRLYPWTLWMKPLRKVGQYLRKL
jgi:hypothetical protein